MLGFPHTKFVHRIGALLCAAVTAGAVTAAAAPVSENAGRRDRVLSNETTVTRWAHVNRITPIRRAPRTSAPRVGRLTWHTPDGFASIYLVLRARRVRGEEWVKLRVPGRPNGRTGWVRRDALGPYRRTHLLLVVNRTTLRIHLYKRGRRIWSAPVGVGKPGTPTPAGHFWVDERFPIKDPGSGYYPYAFGTTAYSAVSDWPGGGVVGIHGPYYAARAIPGRISHGCIRLRVSDLFWLAKRLRLGTPVHVI